MFLFIFLFSVSMVAKSDQLTLEDCGDTYRSPEYNDITVDCGTSSIGLSILLCPVVYSGYNESLIILNQIFDDPQCKGTLDESVSPPVIRFSFPLNETKACGSNFKTTSAAGTGAFSDFSNIQTVNISGVVRSHDTTTGTVTYNTDLKYHFSCSYPLEYLINNTRMDVSASSIVVKDNNGSFISTLSMELYSDINYTTPLIIPPLGIELRTNVYVQVKATNLTDQYHVLLDRCFASTSPHPTNSTYFNLFVPCSTDLLTEIHENGDSHHARFSFPAFRFIEQQNQTVSTYYLHCITRLCERSTCTSFKQCNGRRRRDVDSSTNNEGVSDSTTLSSDMPIITKAENVLASKEAGASSEESDATVGLAVTVGVLAAAVIAVVAVAVVVYQRIKHI